MLRPVLHDPPLCSYLDLKSGRLDLIDVAEMNDAITVYDENAIRMRPKE